MNKNIDVLGRKDVFKKAIFTIEEAEFKHEIKPNQWSEPIFRLNLIRADAVAVLIHNIDTDELIFTDQFRFPTYDKTGGWLLELPAGMIDEGETPEDAVRREMLEEIGYRINDLELLQTFYLSPGTSSERIFLYYATVKNADKQSEGGGLEEEGEFIQVINMSVEKSINALKSGEIADAKTIIGLQWLLSRKS